MKTYLSIFLVCGFTLTSGLAKADSVDIDGRCKRDNQTPKDGIGRNAWAAKCNYINPGLAAGLDADRLFVSFDIDAPVDPSAPCVSARRIGCCQANGCYTPSQRIMFGGSYLPIGKAVGSDVRSVTTLGDLTFAVPMSLKEDPIKAFVVGDTEEDVLTLMVEDGATLQITVNHPMVLATGDIVPAQQVSEGTELLTLYGPKRVVMVQADHYKGPVYNIRPWSTESSANILIAEDFLTGSVRYQNEWAEEQSRLHLRDMNP